MVRGKASDTSVIDALNAATAADKAKKTEEKVSMPEIGSDYLDGLDFDQLSELRDRVDAKLIAKKDEKIQELRDKAATLAKLGVQVDIVVGGAAASRAAKAPSVARVAQTPPEGAEIFRDPNDDTKIWWRGKRGQRPHFAPKD